MCFRRSFLLVLKVKRKKLVFDFLEINQYTQACSNSNDNSSQERNWHGLSVVGSLLGEGGDGVS